MPRTVEAPIELHGIIDSIEAKYEDIIQNHLLQDPAHGRIYLLGDPVMWIGLRAIALSLKDELMSDLSEERAKMLMYRFGQSIGRAEASRLLPRLGLTSTREKIIAGPVWAAFSGFVRVRLLPGSNIVEGDDFFLFYEHPANFEAVLWKEAGRTTTQPLCDFNGGYSSGWCSVAANTTLDAIEVLCEARGDPVCRFIMFPRTRREEYEKRLDDFRTWKPG